MSMSAATKAPSAGKARFKWVVGRLRGQTRHSSPHSIKRVVKTLEDCEPALEILRHSECQTLIFKHLLPAKGTALGVPSYARVMAATVYNKFSSERKCRFYASQGCGSLTRHDKMVEAISIWERPSVANETIRSLQAPFDCPGPGRCRFSRYTISAGLVTNSSRRPYEGQTE